MSKEKSPLIFLLLSAFSILTVLVAKQITRPMDFAFMQLIQSFAFKELDYGMDFFTLIGSVEFSSFALLVVTWYLYRKYDWPGAFLYLFFFMALSGVECIWKFIVPYTAPGPEFSRYALKLGFFNVLTPYSFPSGHVFRSVFLLGIWYQRLSQKPASSNGNSLFQRALIASLILIVGASRVYLGYHWLSDVIGGYLLAWIGLSLASQSPHYELRPA